MPIPYLATASATPLKPRLVRAPRDLARAPATPRMTLALISAVAAIVTLAAQRSAAVGEFDALRDAVERALDAATAPQPDPREASSPDLPPIGDADLAAEAEQLLGLSLRQQQSR
jgi:hypothetical protein